MSKTEMHELPVTEGILKVALDAAQGRPITGIDLVIGELSSIVDDSVQFYFDFLSRGTAAAGATLHIRREPARMVCLACGLAGPAAAPLMPCCPACGSKRLQVHGGREFYVESIDVKDKDEG